MTPPVTLGFLQSVYRIVTGTVSFDESEIMWFVLFSFEAGILDCIQVGEDTFESGLLRIRSEDTSQRRETTQRSVLTLPRE